VAELSAASGDAASCEADRTVAARFATAIALAIAVLAIVVRFWVSHQTHALGEDALITLRYAENIAAGRGWVYNPGERVLGTTTPLFTLILAAAAWLRLPAMSAGIAISILADGVTCWLIARLMARPEICRPAAGLFAALLYALSSTPISVSISGMETALVTCVGMCAIHAYVAGRRRVLAGCGVLLFLLRIDGLLLFGILLLGLAIRERRVPWRAVGLFLLGILPWALFATLYFGSPVPSSVVAKLTVYSHSRWTPGSFTNTVAFNHEAFRSQFTLGWPQRIVSLLFLLGAVGVFKEALVARRDRAGATSRDSASAPDNPAAAGDASVDADDRTQWGLLAAPLLWLLVYYGTMLVSHIPAFPWYFLPPWPLVVITAVLGGVTLLQLAWSTGGIRLWGRLRLTALAASLAACAIAGLLHVRSIERDIAVAQTREDTLRRPLGLWLRDHVAPAERVLLEPIGYAGYYSGRRILDMVGLVSPEVLPYYRTPHALSGIVRGLRPEWLCLRGEERDLLHAQDSALPAADYTLVRPFPSASEPIFYLYHVRTSAR
jgi:hypothetical protein